MLARQIIDNLKEELELTPAVALLGARQVGKTTLAKRIAQEKPSIYLDLESTEDLTKLADPTKFLRENSDKLIILDEIQRMPNIFTVLRGVI